MKKLLTLSLALVLALCLAVPGLAAGIGSSAPPVDTVSNGSMDLRSALAGGNAIQFTDQSGALYGGLYRGPSLAYLKLNIGGTDVVTYQSTGVGITGTLGVSGLFSPAAGISVTTGNLAVVAGSATFKDTYGIVLGTGSDVAIVYDGTNVTFSGTGGLQFKNNTADSSTALILGSGTAALPATTAVADKKFVEFRTESTATSGDSRNMYLYHYLNGAGASGDTLRAMAVIEKAIDTGSGAHVSASFGATGSVSGLAAAARTTLHIPDSALAAAGTYTALQGEIYSDGSSSDPSAVTELAALRLANSGDGTGAGLVDDKAAIISLTGWGDGTGNAVYTHNPGNTFSGSIKILVNGAVKYLYFADSE